MPLAETSNRGATADWFQPLLGFVLLAWVALHSAQSLAALDAGDNIMEHVSESWTGDLDGITERGFLRILTVHNPLFFSFDGADQRGMVAEWGKALEEHLAEEIGRVRSPTIVFKPVSRAELIPFLMEGRGDLIMGNLTITNERQKLVDFGSPIHTGVSELVVTGPSSVQVQNFDDLVETGLYIRRSSSYYEHMLDVNRERKLSGKAIIPLTAADENLEDYDLLEMVNAGVLDAIVVDSHKAEFWEQVFDKINVRQDLVVRSGSRIAWAMRKDSPQLQASINRFAETVKRGSLLGNIVIRRYLGNTNWLDNALSEESRERYEEVVEFIKLYAYKYDFDWLMIAAQAYQESRFDQSKVSPAGAVGVMQLLPTTAADDVVNIEDIDSLENNIHAGVKYLHWLRETYFSDDKISPLDQVLFSFAAYNAGPGNMRKARNRARRLGFDPNRWFGNVDIGMYRAVSGEPASYVRNIYKYYVTYEGLERSRIAREKALEAQFEETDTPVGSKLQNLMIGFAALLLAWGFYMLYLRRKNSSQESIATEN